MVHLLVGVVGAALIVLIAMRYGLLALAVMFFTENVLFFAPPDLRFGTWYFARPLMVALLMLGLALYAFRCALAGRSPFGRLLEET